MSEAGGSSTRRFLSFENPEQMRNAQHAAAEVSAVQSTWTSSPGSSGPRKDAVLIIRDPQREKWDQQQQQQSRPGWTAEGDGSRRGGVVVPAAAPIVFSDPQREIWYSTQRGDS